MSDSDNGDMPPVLPIHSHLLTERVIDIAVVNGVYDALILHIN